MKTHHFQDICRTIILHLVVQDNHDWVTAKEIQQYPWMGELKAETITQHMQHAAKKSNLEPSDSISQTSDSFVEYDKMGSVCYDHMSHSLQHLLVALDQRGRTALAADFKYLRKPDPTIKDRKARVCLPLRKPISSNLPDRKSNGVRNSSKISGNRKPSSAKIVPRHV